MKKLYNIKRGTSGVYLITNKINGKRYVGSSVDIAGRLSNHFNREPRLYPDKEFYIDIVNFGKENFSYEVLEECERDKLIEREQYYYDTLKPEYNMVRPAECNFYNSIVRQKAQNTCQSEEFRKKRHDVYTTDYYRNLFSHVQDKRKRKVEMYKDGVFVEEFNSMCDCQKWLNEHTKFTGKNKVAKIKAVCDGDRPTAFGYTFKYKETSND